VLSQNAAASFIVRGVEGYTTFVVYADIAFTNTPFELRFRPLWAGFNSNSWCETRVGYWSDFRINVNAIRSGYTPAVFAGPILGEDLLFIINANLLTSAASGGITLREISMRLTQKPIAWS
jgi:hypothetical protein